MLNNDDHLGYGYYLLQFFMANKYIFIFHLYDNLNDWEFLYRDGLPGVIKLIWK